MKEKQAFDNYNPTLFPRLERAAEVIGSAIKFVVSPLKTELCLSEHKRGAAEMLDEGLYHQYEIEFNERD